VRADLQVSALPLSPSRATIPSFSGGLQSGPPSLSFSFRFAGLRAGAWWGATFLTVYSVGSVPARLLPARVPPPGRVWARSSLRLVGMGGLGPEDFVTRLGYRSSKSIGEVGFIINREPLSLPSPKQTQQNS